MKPRLSPFLLVLLVVGSVCATNADTSDAVQDPAAVSGMVLWVDERGFAPDHSAASTIELNNLGQKAYAEMLSVAPGTREDARYLGSLNPAKRPILDSYHGWRAPRFHWDNTLDSDGNYNGTQLGGINLNAVTTTPHGTMNAYLPFGLTGYTALVTAILPTTVDGRCYCLLGSAGAQWGIYIQRGGGALYAYIFHQGISGQVSPGINLYVGGFAHDGDRLVFAPWWDGTNVQMEIMRADGTVVSSISSASRELGHDMAAYGLAYGSFNGANSWDERILAAGICQRAMSMTERRFWMKWLNDKYTATTTRTWADGAVPIDPLTVHPDRLWAPGPFVVTADGFVTSVPNQGGDGASGFSATGIQRPRLGKIGTHQALVCDGTNTWMTQTRGTEADINGNRDAQTIIGLMEATAQLPTYPATPTTISGDSGLASPLVYIGGGIRGPMFFYPASWGNAQTTIIGWIPPKQTLVYANQTDPDLLWDGHKTVRAISNGAMQSSYGDPLVGSLAGVMRLGVHVGNVFHGRFVPPYFWSCKLTYREIQGIRRRLVLDAGLALPSR